MDHRRSMADTSGQTYEEPLLAGWAARGWGMGGGTWAMKACLPAMVLLRAVEGGERRACRVVVEVAVGNALPASSGRVALSTLRDGPPAGRSGRRRPWAGRAATSAVGGGLFGWFFLWPGFYWRGPLRLCPSLSVWVLWVLWVPLSRAAPALLPSHSPAPAHSQLPASHWPAPAHAPSHRSPPHSPPIPYHSIIR
jgi:hypothetical protein